MPSILTPDFGLLFWMLISFLVVFLLLAKYGFPVIVKMVEERKAYIDSSLQHAREANERLAGIKAESERILKEAQDAAAKMRAEAKAQGEDIVRKAKEDASAAHARIVAEGRAQIAAEKEAALSDVKAQVAELSIRIAERVMLRQLSGDAEQEKYIDRLLTEMK